MKRVVGSMIVLMAGLTLAGLLVAADAPAAQQPKPDADGFYSLFDGKTLDGWKIGGAPETFKVQDGTIVANGPVSHLFYEGPVHNHDFKNFHLKAEVMTQPNSNSGIYFHTAFQDKGFPNKGFEAQVNNTHKDPRKTGSLYMVKDVMNNSPAQDNKWFLYEIIVKDNHITLKVDGKDVMDTTLGADYKPPAKMPGRVLDHGTIALQGHDPGSKVQFKNILIKPLD